MVGELELEGVEGGKGHGISVRGALPLRSRKVVAHLRGECRGGDKKEGWFRPEVDDPPRNGEGDHRRWWRGTGGAALRIKDRKHLAWPSTLLPMVPLPQRGRIGNIRSPPQRRHPLSYVPPASLRARPAIGLRARHATVAGSPPPPS